MTEYPQLKAILDPIDAHERNLADEAGQARARIEELTARLRGLDEDIENLLTTRKTLRALPDPPGAETPAQPEVPDPHQVAQGRARPGRGRPLRRRPACPPWPCRAERRGRETSAAAAVLTRDHPQRGWWPCRPRRGRCRLLAGQGRRTPPSGLDRRRQ